VTIVLVVGGLTFLVGLVILRPFSHAPGIPQRNRRVPGPPNVRRRELLRQLRDLDDDLTAGKLTEADHARLRGPVEREAAAVLRGIKSQTRATDTAAGSSPARSRAGGGAAKRWRRRTVTVLAMAGGIAGATVLLLGTVSPRTAGQDISGDNVAGAAGGAAPSGAPSDAASADGSGQQAPTPDQLAAIDAAVARVKQNPKDVSAHLALADAYAAGGQGQLAAVEYLAVTQLDPTNAEANTNLALLAFEVGQTGQAKTMVDRVLSAHPNYPDALYVRGLILLMGLRQPQAAARDLNAYLAVAPFGSHRTAAATLLALASSQEHQ
jgi:hypothetical protein